MRSGALRLLCGLICFFGALNAKGSISPRLLEARSEVVNSGLGLGAGLQVPGVWGIELRAWSWDGMLPGVWTELSGRWSFGTPSPADSVADARLVSPRRSLTWMLSPVSRRWRLQTRRYILEGGRNVASLGDRLVLPVQVPTVTQSSWYVLAEQVSNQSIDDTSSASDQTWVGLGWNRLSIQDTSVAFSGYGSVDTQIFKQLSIGFDIDAAALNRQETVLATLLQYQVQWRGLFYALRSRVIWDGFDLNAAQVNAELSVGIALNRLIGKPMAELDLACVMALANDPLPGASSDIRVCRRL